MAFRVLRDNLERLAFPKRCSRCSQQTADGRAGIRETTFWTRRVLDPSPWLTVPAFVALVAIGVGVEQRYQVSAMWLAPIAFVLIGGTLRLLAERSARTVWVPFCARCSLKQKISSATTMVTAVLFVSSLSLSWSGILGQSSPRWLILTVGTSFIILLGAQLLAGRFSPMIDFRRAGRHHTVVAAGRPSFGEDVAALNPGLVEPPINAFHSAGRWLGQKLRR